MFRTSELLTHTWRALEAAIQFSASGCLAASSAWALSTWRISCRKIFLYFLFCLLLHPRTCPRYFHLFILYALRLSQKGNVEDFENERNPRHGQVLQTHLPHHQRTQVNLLRRAQSPRSTSKEPEEPCRVHFRSPVTRAAIGIVFFKMSKRQS